MHMTQMTLSLYRPVIRARPRTYTPYKVETSFASWFPEKANEIKGASFASFENGRRAKWCHLTKTRTTRGLGHNHHQTATALKQRRRKAEMSIETSNRITDLPERIRQVWALANGGNAA